MKCKITNSAIDPFMSFGKMPIANGFLYEKDFKNEFFFEMEVGFNEALSLFQLNNHPSPSKMFNENYPFFTSSSEFMKLHFKKYASWIKKRYMSEYSKLIEKYPEKKELLYNVGNLYLLKGNTTAALENYAESLHSNDPLTQADALYNMGNIFHQSGELEKSVKLYKDALMLNPNDKDIRHNYELSKRMLEMQPPQQQNGDNQKDKEDKSEQEEGPQSQSEKSENDDEEQRQQSQQNQGEENQSELKDQQEENRVKDQEQAESKSLEDQEKQIAREEAEAILNALKADEKNLKQKKYHAVGKVKLEKDW